MITFYLSVNGNPHFENGRQTAIQAHTLKSARHTAKRRFGDMFTLSTEPARPDQVPETALSSAILAARRKAA
jgi:hypothetical protein